MIGFSCYLDDVHVPGTAESEDFLADLDLKLNIFESNDQ